MIFEWLWKHLPPRLAAMVATGLYAVSMLVLWWRWEAPSAPFRYVGF